MFVMKQIKIICGVAGYFNMNLVNGEWLIFHVSFAWNGVIRVQVFRFAHYPAVVNKPDKSIRYDQKVWSIIPAGGEYFLMTVMQGIVTPPA